jgi:hypothetical protein
VFHGFIDGFSRLITGIRTSNNNQAETVFALFKDIVQVHGVPSRMRGDHGIENGIVARWMEVVRGLLCGSYIWGRYVHLLVLLLVMSQICFAGAFITSGLSNSGGI